MPQIRGVLVPVAGDAGEWFSISACNGNELMVSALYWDRIVAPILTDNPRSGIFHPQYFADARELVSLGVAEAPVLLKSGQLTPSGQTKLLNAQADIIRNTMSKEDAYWSILDGHAIKAENIADSKATPNDYELLHVHLMNALPIPAPNTPLESIVAFRDKRRDELERVHIELGHLASTYVGSAPSAQAIPRALQDLNLALSDARRVFNERWSTRFFHNLKASFVSEAVLPAAAYHFFKLPLDKAFLIGAGLAVARSSYSSLFGKPNPTSPYSVLFDAENIR